MEQQLKEMIAGLLKMDEGEVTDSLAMRSVEAWDSLKHMELVGAIEQAIGEELTFDEIVAMKTFKDIKQIVNAKRVDGQRGA